MSRRRSALAAGLVGLVLLAAGCGSPAQSPSVASLGAQTTATTTTAGSKNKAASSTPGGGSGSFSSSLRVGAAGPAFSACMRSHGVPNFPDPNGQGSITFGSSDGIDPGSPQFQSAQQACQKLLPHGGAPSPAQQAKAQAAMLRYSACMRSHGVPKFPDPSFSNGGRISLKIDSRSGIDPQSPQFQSAQKACQGEMPGKLGAKTGSGGKALGSDG